MVTFLDRIVDVADRFDAIVLDQWGVLHDGSAPYPFAIQTLNTLNPYKLGLLSNSGKRTAPNIDRVNAMGFDAGQFHTIMTSGEALWQIFDAGDHKISAVYPIEGRAGDALHWAKGLSLDLVDDVTQADAILLMGLPDGVADDLHDTTLQAGIAHGLPLYCSNPDLTSPRANGAYVSSPGALAARYQHMGGTVYLYGKPHLPIFQSTQVALGCAPDKILMVGDSLHHDIKGANNAGWASLLIESGVHAPDIAQDKAADIARLSQAAQTPPPTYSLSDLR